MKTKNWLMLYFLLAFIFACFNNYPWLILSGFLLVTTKLNEIQEDLNKKKENGDG